MNLERIDVNVEISKRLHLRPQGDHKRDPAEKPKWLKLMRGEYLYPLLSTMVSELDKEITSALDHLNTTRSTQNHLNAVTWLFNGRLDRTPQNTIQHIQLEKSYEYPSALISTDSIHAYCSQLFKVNKYSTTYFSNGSLPLYADQALFYLSYNLDGSSPDTYKTIFHYDSPISFEENNVESSEFNRKKYLALLNTHASFKSTIILQQLNRLYNAQNAYFLLTNPRMADVMHSITALKGYITEVMLVFKKNIQIRQETFLYFKNCITQTLEEIDFSKLSAFLSKYKEKSIFFFNENSLNFLKDDKTHLDIQRELMLLDKLILMTGETLAIIVEYIDTYTKNVSKIIDIYISPEYHQHLLYLENAIVQLEKENMLAFLLNPSFDIHHNLQALLINHILPIQNNFLIIGMHFVDEITASAYKAAEEYHNDQQAKEAMDTFIEFTAEFLKHGKNYKKKEYQTMISIFDSLRDMVEVKEEKTEEEKILAFSKSTWTFT